MEVQMAALYQDAFTPAYLLCASLSGRTNVATVRGGEGTWQGKALCLPAKAAPMQVEG